MKKNGLWYCKNYKHCSSVSNAVLESHIDDVRRFYIVSKTSKYNFEFSTSEVCHSEISLRKNSELRLVVTINRFLNNDGARLSRRKAVISSIFIRNKALLSTIRSVSIFLQIRN